MSFAPMPAMQALNAVFSKEQAEIIVALLDASGSRHIAMEDVEGLQTALDDIDQRLAALEGE